MTVNYRQPNFQQAPVAQQSRPDAGDFRGLAAIGRGTGVIEGGAVTANGIGLTVDIAAGIATIAGTDFEFSSAQVTPDAATSSPRIDLVVVNAAGTVSVLKGSPVDVSTAGGPEWPSAYTPETYVVLARLDIVANLTLITSTQIVDKRIPAQRRPPYQWLASCVVGGNERPQVVPDASWTPVHWGLVVHDSTIGRPVEGSSSSNILNSPTLTPAGSQTIEIVGGGIAAIGLNAVAALQPEYLIIEDTTANLSQIVRYTGLSAGTGTAGRDEITGVSLGSWTITGGTRYNIRQAAPYLIRPSDVAAAIGSNFLSCLETTIAWEGNATGWRRVRQAAWINLFGLQKYDVFQGTDVPGGNPPDGIQVQNDMFQPGYTTDTPNPQFVEVYQNSGGDLELRLGPLSVLPGWTCAFQTWFTTRE